MKPRPCPTVERHHPDEPTGYPERALWAEQMSRTHVQRRCPGCGLFAVWEPSDHDLRTEAT